MLLIILFTALWGGLGPAVRGGGLCDYGTSPSPALPHLLCETAFMCYALAVCLMQFLGGHCGCLSRPVARCGSFAFEIS